MRCECPDCKKAYNIPDERLQKGKKIAFICPACKKGRIVLDLREKGAPEAAPEAAPAAAPESDGDQPIMGEELKKKILNDIDELPPMPQVVIKAQEVMDDPDSGMKDLAEILETDQGVTSKVLKLSNSAYFGMSGKVASIQQAAVILGEKMLGDVVTLAGTSNLLGSKLQGYGMASGDLWRHSMAVAFGAKLIAQASFPALAQESLIAGLMHDAGKIILDPVILERGEQFDAFMNSGERTFLQAEQELLGFGHPEIAAEVCKKWNIPDNIIHSIRYHHNPGQSDNDDMAYILHMADYMATMSGIGIGIDDVLYKLEDGSMDFLKMNQEKMSSLVLEVIEAVEKMESFQK
ncbi:MAG: HDOD domain-containing protein [Desulfobacterales bacterium]|nr:HDOD domain-containing protein [Desulfobacterales bacterium]